MKAQRILSTLILALGLTLVTLLGLSNTLPDARALTYIVTNTDASGPGSLRQAILDANSNAGYDTIHFAPGLNGTIVLTGALPAIAGDLALEGPGATELAVSGADTYRVFYVNSGVAVTLTGLTVRDGRADRGGGIYSLGTLVLSDTHVVSNTATQDGGGLCAWSGRATLLGGLMAHNHAAIRGGGICMYDSSVILSRTHILDNDVDNNGGGVYVDRAGG